eukprot:6550204-Heterocapsa_arctica.AAC.1
MLPPVVGVGRGWCRLPLYPYRLVQTTLISLAAGADYPYIPSGWCVQTTPISLAAGADYPYIPSGWCVQTTPISLAA